MYSFLFPTEMEQIIASIDRTALNRPKKLRGSKFIEAAGDKWHGPPAAASEFSEKVRQLFLPKPHVPVPQIAGGNVHSLFFRSHQ
jgi:hypothetical protein